MLKGLAFLLLAALSSRIIFVLNVRQNPQLPWFVLADVLMLVILIRLLAYPSIYSRMRRTPLSVAVLFGVCGVLGSTCVGIIQGWASESHVSSLPPVSGAAQLFSIAAMLFTPLYGGAVEEIVFRGFFQRALEERFGNFIGLISTTAMFVATHAMNSGFESQWMFYLCFSISLGLVAQLSGSLVLCVVLHCGFNAASSIVTMIHGPIALGQAETWMIATLVVVIVVSTVVMATIVRRQQAQGRGESENEPASTRSYERQ